MGQVSFELAATAKGRVVDAVVVGAKPVDDPSLADDQVEFARLNEELFGDGTGTHSVGKGKMFAGQKLEDVFAVLQVKPDFEPAGKVGDNEPHLGFVHRKLTDGDIYFVDNRSTQARTVDAKFRVTGKAPELWYAETGKSKPVSYTIAEGQTTVPLSLEPWGTVFVVSGRRLLRLRMWNRRLRRHSWLR